MQFKAQWFYLYLKDPVRCLFIFCANLYSRRRGGIWISLVSVAFCLRGYNARFQGRGGGQVPSVCACCVLLRVVVGRGSSTRGRDQMTQTVKCIPSRLLCSILEFHLSGNSAFSVSLRTVLLLIGLILGTIVLSSFLPFPFSHIAEFGGTWLCFGGISLYLVVLGCHFPSVGVFLLPWSHVVLSVRRSNKRSPTPSASTWLSLKVQLFNCTYDDSLF